MSEERPPSDRHGERDSQLSAMFDGEVSAAECELLARRLSRDEALRAQWSRFALIGAALRAERGVILHERVAWRVQSALAQEPSYGDANAVEGSVASPARVPAQGAGTPQMNASRWMRFARPAFGAGIAAGVAALSILWLRTQESPDTMLAAAPAPGSETITLTPEPASLTVAQTAPAERRSTNGEPGLYSTPPSSSQSSFAPPARLANYVVAHSEYSGPLARRMALLGIVGNEAQAESGEANAAPAASNKPAGAADAP